jgi:hypothetical protein
MTPSITADKLREMGDLVQMTEAWEAKRGATKKLTATAEQGASAVMRSWQHNYSPLPFKGAILPKGWGRAC